MLGWQFVIRRKNQNEQRDSARAVPPLAGWYASLGGDKWIFDLVARGLATDLGGDGYPSRYTLTAGTLGAVLAEGLPKHDGPAVFGDDYALPAGWTGNAQIDLERIKALDSSEVLLVEAWDQS